MDKELYEELESNLKESVKVARGRLAPNTTYVMLSPEEIRAIRRRIGMSQSVFATTFHLSIETIKGWEQGKRRPDAAASNYLRIIDADPNWVRKALAA